MNKNQQLQKQIDELKAEIERLKRQMIVVVGDYDGTNVPVTVHGIRRKIATSSP